MKDVVYDNYEYHQDREKEYSDNYRHLQSVNCIHLFIAVFLVVVVVRLLTVAIRRRRSLIAVHRLTLLVLRILSVIVDRLLRRYLLRTRRYRSGVPDNRRLLEETCNELCDSLDTVTDIEVHTVHNNARNVLRYTRIEHSGFTEVIVSESACGIDRHTACECAVDERTDAVNIGPRALSAVDIGGILLRSCIALEKLVFKPCVGSSDR